VVSAAKRRGGAEQSVGRTGNSGGGGAASAPALAFARDVALDSDRNIKFVHGGMKERRRKSLVFFLCVFLGQLFSVLSTFCFFFLLPSFQNISLFRKLIIIYHSTNLHLIFCLCF
jgi:hypothetical protein